MKIPAVIMAIAAAALTVSAATVEVQFNQALKEKDPARRGEALLKLAETGSYPAELALIHLTRANLPPRSFARLLPVARFRFGELVPAVLLVRSYRQEESSKSPAELSRSELFDLAHTAWKNAAVRELSPFEQRLFRELSGEVLRLAWECGETAQIFTEVEQRIGARGKAWAQDFPLSVLLEFFYRHAFVTGGFELYTQDWSTSSARGRSAFAAVLGELRRHAPENDAELAARVRFLISIGETDQAILSAAEQLLGKQSQERINLLIFAVVQSGRYDMFDTIKPLLKKTGLTPLKAAAFARGGKYAEALKLLPGIADPAQRADLELKCRMGLGEYSAAAALAEDPASPLDNEQRILALLTMAEETGDAAFYRAAERLAGDRIDTDAGLSNSFGYVALLLGIDRDLAEKRIRYALSIQPDNSAFLDSLAWARHLAGDHAGAWTQMEAALRRCTPEPESCDVLAHAAAIRLALGDREGARRCCEMALKLAQYGEKKPAVSVYFKSRVANIRKLLEQMK